MLFQIKGTLLFFLRFVGFVCLFFFFRSGFVPLQSITDTPMTPLFIWILFMISSASALMKPTSLFTAIWAVSPFNSSKVLKVMQKLWTKRAFRKSWTFCATPHWNETTLQTSAVCQRKGHAGIPIQSTNRRAPTTAVAVMPTQFSSNGHTCRVVASFPVLNRGVFHNDNAHDYKSARLARLTSIRWLSVKAERPLPSCDNVIPDLGGQPGWGDPARQWRRHRRDSTRPSRLRRSA